MISRRIYPDGLPPCARPGQQPRGPPGLPMADQVRDAVSQDQDMKPGRR
jgi:hypothetical protein